MSLLNLFHLTKALKLLHERGTVILHKNIHTFENILKAILIKINI
jgi:hypothetical protein